MSGIIQHFCFVFIAQQGYGRNWVNILGYVTSLLYTSMKFVTSNLLSMYSGTRIKTRKRNIAAPLDPAAFADAVVQIYLDNAGDLVIFSPMHHSLLLQCSLFLLKLTKFVMCRNLFPRASSLQTLTFQDTVTPFLRQVYHRSLELSNSFI